MTEYAWVEFLRDLSASDRAEVLQWEIGRQCKLTREVESMRAALKDLEDREKIDWSAIVTRMVVAHAHTRSECIMMCRENVKLRARIKELEQ